MRDKARHRNNRISYQQAFLFDTPNEAFSVSVLLWNIGHGVNQFDTSTIQNHLKLLCVERIIVADKEPFPTEYRGTK